MHYTIIPPPYQLSSFIRSFWTLEGTTHTLEPMPYRLFADACPNIVFSYGSRFKNVKDGGGDEKMPISILHGQTQLYQDMTVSGSFGLVGVYLYPTALSLLFDSPACQLTGEAPDIQSVLGKQGEELEDKILNAFDNEERILHIITFFNGKLARYEPHDRAIDHCVHRILNSDGNVPINLMAEEANISQRHLERKFLAQSGLSPKLFARITRFRKVIKLSNQLQFKTLSSLAYQAGYSDQSHFIREFKEFSGHTPRAYFKQSMLSADTFVELSS